MEKHLLILYCCKSQQTTKGIGLGLAKNMPMNAVSRFVGEHDTRLWRVLHHYVDNAIAAQDLSYVTKINTDETSAKRGHNNVTIFMDPEQKNMICVTNGKGSSTWDECKKQLESHASDAFDSTRILSVPGGNRAHGTEGLDSMGA
ncbi:hypothetical protein ACH6EH_11450 [Paenibacillus sp. JSM ZJ436]|uniref:hypothetical protein n=1 Tax=Paenibacillus sp. JSM ZJ436 TaxID=3376190 RepID=UPI00378CA7C5